MLRSIEISDKETYEVGREIYVQWAGGIDPRSFKILEARGNDQYKLSRNGNVGQEVCAQANWCTLP